MLCFFPKRLMQNKIIKIEVEKQRHEQEETNMLDSRSNIFTGQLSIKFTWSFLATLKERTTARFIKLYPLVEKGNIPPSSSCVNKNNMHMALTLGT